MIDMSTAHLKQSTRNALQSESVSGVIAYKKSVWGYFLFVPEDGPTILEESVPQDLKAIIAYAHERKVEWVMLDVDAEQVSELPVYPDEVLPLPPGLHSLATEFASHLSKRTGKQITTSVMASGNILVESSASSKALAEVTPAFAAMTCRMALPVLDIAFVKERPVSA